LPSPTPSGEAAAPRGADAVVDDFERQGFVPTLHRDVKMPGRDPRRYPVLDRVFDQGLQEEARHHGLASGRIDVESNREAVGEPDELDVDVVTEDLELAIEADLLLAGST
jgi:hypothetical protein